MEVAITSMAEALNADVHLLLQSMNKFYKFIYTIARYNYIYLIHHGSGAVDSLQEGASGFPDSICPLVSISNQHITSTLLQTNLGYTIISLGNILCCITIKFQQQISICLIIREALA